MFIKNWKKEIVTIPNLLSLFRLILLPVYVHIYMTATTDKQFLVAGSIMVLSCLTDLFDGKIARSFNQITNLGKILDPLADKITQFTLTFCLSLKYSVLHPVLALFIVKELFQLIMGLIHFMQGRMLPGALMSGKVCTTILFVSLTALVLLPNMKSGFINFIATVDGIFLTISFVSYISAYLGKNPKVQDMGA